MKQSTFTVKTKDGTSYSANHLSVTRRSVYATGDDGLQHGVGQESVLCFVCSGEMIQVRAADVESVEWHPAANTYCSECDGSVWNVVGTGIHANPQPPGA